MRHIVKLIEVDGESLSIKELKNVQVDNLEHFPKNYIESDEFKNEISCLINNYDPKCFYKLLILIKTYYEIDINFGTHEKVDSVTLLDIYQRSKEINDLLAEI